MNDGIIKLHDINNGLQEREKTRRASFKESPSNNKKNDSNKRSNSMTITPGSREDTVYRTARQFKSIEEENSGSEDEGKGKWEGAIEDDKMFDGMIERIHERCKFEGTMASQVDRLSASAQFMVKIADGYTQKTFY